MGHLHKDEVRAYARARGLAVADKPDSQELCFVADGNTARFVEERLPARARAGPIRDQQGRQVGDPAGVHRFTVGQRKGLGLSTSVPLYVLSIDAAQNALTVGPRPALDRTRLTASSVNWIAGAPPCSPYPVTARIRHRHPDAPATVEPLPDNRAAVVFETPQSAVAPGQAVVFYNGDTVLGGGWID